MAGAAFLAAVVAFLAGGAALLVVTAFLAVAATLFLDVAGDFVDDDAGFFAALTAFFTTGAAFFFVGAGRFVAVASTFAEVFFFPARAVVAGAGRDAGARLTWAPLLAGVIVPSFGPRHVAGFPGYNLAWGAGDDTGREGQGQQALLSRWVDQRDPGAPEMDAFSRFRVGAPSSASGRLP